MAHRIKKKATDDNPAESRILYVLEKGALSWLLSGIVYPLGMLSAPLILYPESPEVVEYVVRHVLIVWVSSLIILSIVIPLAVRRAMKEQNRSQNPQ